MANVFDSYDPGASPSPEVLDAAVERAGAQHDVDPGLIHAVMRQESGGNAGAVSPQGAGGLMQLTPETAHSLGVSNLFDWQQSLDAGTRYLRQGLDRYGGRGELALAYYHGGPNTEMWGPKTANYSSKVWDAYQQHRARRQQQPQPQQANPFDAFDRQQQANPFDQLDQPAAADQPPTRSQAFRRSIELGNTMAKAGPGEPADPAIAPQPQSLADAMGAPEVMGGAPASMPTPGLHPAAQRVLEVMRDAYGDAPLGLDGSGIADLRKLGIFPELGAVDPRALTEAIAKPLIAAADFARRAAGAGFAGAQRAILETALSLGLSDTAARSLAAMPEAFMGSPMHLNLPPRGYGRTTRELGREATNPVGYVDPAAHAYEGGWEPWHQYTKPEPTRLALPAPEHPAPEHPPGSPEGMAADIAQAKQEAADIRQAKVPSKTPTLDAMAAEAAAQIKARRPVTPEQAAIGYERPVTPRSTNQIQREEGVGHNQAVRIRQAEIDAAAAPAQGRPQRQPTPRVSQVQTPEVIPLGGPPKAPEAAITKNPRGFSETVPPAATPEAAAPAPDQQALHDRIMAVADEWDALGDPRMAQAIRGGAKMPQGGVFTPQGVAFLEQRLAEKKAQLDPNLPKPQETFDLDAFQSGATGKPLWADFTAKAPEEAKQLTELVRQHGQSLVDRMNQLGFEWRRAHETGDPQGKALRQELSGLNGTFSRYVREEVGNRRGDKRYKPAGLVKARDELLRALGVPAKETPHEAGQVDIGRTSSEQPVGKAPSEPEHGPTPAATPEQPEQPKAQAEQPKSERGADYGANNKTFTAEAADRARERLRERLRRLSAGFDPEFMLDGLILAGYHIEAGARKFADYARAMIEDLGEGARPFLAHFYQSVRDYPGFDAAGMDDAAAVTAYGQAHHGPERTPGLRSETSPGRGETPRGGQPSGAAGERHPENLAPDTAGDVPPVGSHSAGEPGAGAERPEIPVEGPVHTSGAGPGGGGAGGDQGLADAGPGAGSGRGLPPARDAARPNFHITDPKALVAGTPKVRFARNRAAIEALHAVEEEQRTPTAEELDAMARYIGWGSFGQELFQGTFERVTAPRGWETEAKWLRDHLGKEAWESAQRSIINAHYTDPPTVQAMWDMARRMGFTGGRVLEPSMGIGNFFGLMPRDLMANSRLTGIELDRTTSAMAKLLYPEAGIHTRGYQDSKTPDGFYDLVIGNWPFGQTGPADRRYDKLGPSLHDYFFLKALDQTRPGGLVMGITSRYTMDRVNRSIRAEMAKKSELVAAFRMPTGAFEDYAGTAVVADLLVFRKLAAPPANVMEVPWVNTHQTSVAGNELALNKRWAEHPDDVLGTMTWGRSTVGQQSLNVVRPENYAAILQALPDRLPQGIYQPPQRGSEPRYITNTSSDRQGSVVIGKDGNLYQVQGERLARLDDLTKRLQGKERDKRIAQVKDLVGLRKVYGELLDAERAGAPDTEAKRAALAEQYQAFRAKHGSILDAPGLKLLEAVKDPSYGALASLERPDGTPSRILTGPTIRATRAIANPSVADAYVIQRNQSKTLDLDRIADLANTPRPQVADELLHSGAIYRTPGGGFEAADVYLSGNVRRKLREAQEAAENGDDMAGSIAALEKVIPQTIPYYQIEAKLGAPWVGDSAYKSYLAHLLGLAENEHEGMLVRFAGGRWRVDLPDRLRHRMEARTGTYGTEVYPFHKLFEAALSNRVIKIYGRDIDGNRVLDEKATEEANQKTAAIREHFADWVWADAERKMALEAGYNEALNAIARPRYNGSFLDMSGMALRRGEDPFSLRQHQLNAIWRGVQLGRGLFAHEVGTGKTFTMGGIAVEGRRYGVFRKPLILGHNANSMSVYQELQQMYPGGQFLYLDNLAPETLQASLHRIANEDWDAIVMPHSVIDRLTLTRETLMNLAAQEIAELESEAMEAAADDGVGLTPGMMDDPEAMKKVRSVTAKNLVKQRERIIANIDKQANRASAEGAVPFEQLGVDALIVDEAHEFKKPPIATRMQMRGLNTQTSNRSIALNFLTGYVKGLNEGRGVYLFTGTPITNTLNEIFNMGRFFMDDRMQKDGIRDWDTWFNTFADAATDVELTAAGTYEPVTRLSSFVNTDELVRVMSEFTDVVQAKDMPEFVARPTAEGRTDKPEGRPFKQIRSDVAEMTPGQKDILAHLQTLSTEFKEADKRQRRQWMLSGDEHNPILIETNAANASLDPRLYDPRAEDHPDSKINRVARNVAAIYREPGAAQVVFVDRGYAPSKASPGFVLVKELVDKLVDAGIPRKEIQVVAGGVTAEQKAEIAKRMNNGVLRVVIGQSGTLGVGVNMQRQLRAMHHMDAPWRPGDLEQRNGRGERQGNEWNTVHEIRYVTEGIDGRRWQVLSAKDRFIKQFIEAFRREEGAKRIGTIEGDAADISEDENLLSTLSQAAGDPRLMMLAKLKSDITRLERRERSHSMGQADAASTARTLRQALAQHNERRAERGAVLEVWEAAEARMEEAAKAAGAKARWYDATILGEAAHTGEEVQAALDKAMADTAQGERRDLGSINGFGLRVEPSLSITTRENRLALVEPTGRANQLATPTMTAIRGAIQSLRHDVRGGPTDFEQRVARLEQQAKEPFPHQGKLDQRRAAHTKLEADLQNNPIPPPAWLRHGAPVDSRIYVQGRPYAVTGHGIEDGDFVVRTEDGDVPYRSVQSESGRPLFDDHGRADEKQESPLPGEATAYGYHEPLYSFPGMLVDPALYRRLYGPFAPVMRGLAQRAKTYAGSVADWIAPMQAGSVRAQGIVTQFANDLRRSQFRYAQLDKELTRHFTVPQRDAMGRALDAQSVFEQRLRVLRDAAQQAAARREFDAAGTGLAGLPVVQRQAIEALNTLSMNVWERMRDRGMVAPEARALPYYMPRQILLWTEANGYTRAPGGPGGAGRGYHQLGENLTTAGPMRREHLTPEQTEAAARAKLGDSAVLLRDIRSLPARLAYAERAVAGRDLMDQIEEVGRLAGEDLVRHGELPATTEPGDFFTMDEHPSFWRWTGPIRRPIYVASEFKEPLRAVLSQRSSDLYRGVMKIKGGMMRTILWSPFQHLNVEIGRAFPMMRSQIVNVFKDGNRVRKSPDYMDTAITDGISPLGNRNGWSQDPVAIADETLDPGRSGFISRLVRARDAVAARAGPPGSLRNEIVRDPHQALLWDRVFDLQMGIYDHSKRQFVKQGFPERVAGIMAAHLANRYAGALPPEHLRRGVNMAANLLLFSRSFTLGNLGVIKDMMNGAPSHIRALIEREAGPKLAQDAQAKLRRKARSAFVMDIGLQYIGNALAQLAWRGLQVGLLAGGAAYLLQGLGQSLEEWQDEATTALTNAASNPLEFFGIFPQHWNEPGKEDRVFLGTDSSGRGVYLRLMIGKIGEEFLKWFTDPADLLLAKLNVGVRPAVEAAIGYDGLGRRISMPHPQTIWEHITAAGEMVKHIASNFGPVSTIQGVQELATGKPGADPWVSWAKIIGPALGLGSVSQGYPGGPAAGEMHAQDERQRYLIQKAMPAIRDKIKAGDRPGATADMNALGIPPRLRTYYIRQTEHPGSVSRRQRQQFQRTASPEVQERLERHRAMQSPAAP